MNIKSLFPRRLAEYELFKEVIELLQEIADSNEAEFNDVLKKYTVDEDTKVEVVEEILFERGLSSLYELIALVPNANVQKIAPYVSAIILLKGRIEGFRLVLDLLNFDYSAVIWYEQSPKGLPHTISLEVTLDSSEIDQPYQVFQKIKKFTNDYLYPIISPLGYNYDVSIDDFTSTAKAKFHPDYLSLIEFEVDESELLGTSSFFLQSPDLSIWNIRISNTGILHIDPEDPLTEPSILFRFAKNGDPLEGYYILEVDNSGILSAIPSSDVNIPIWFDFYLPDNKGRAWRIMLDNFDEIFTQMD